MEERNLRVYLDTNTCSSFCERAVPMQCHICPYWFFQVDVKTHENQTWRRETSQFFLKHTLAVHFVKMLLQCDICDYCCFQVVIKTHAKIGKNFIEKSNGSVSKATP